MHGSQMSGCCSNSPRECSAAVLIQRCIEHFKGKGTGTDRTRSLRAMKGISACDGRGRGISAAQAVPSSSNAESIAAERELAAFYAAVSETYGPEAALLAAEDWIQELEKRPVEGAASIWRTTTISAAVALASRVVARS